MSGRAGTGRRLPHGSRAASRTVISTRSSRRCHHTGTGRWWRSTYRPGREPRSCCRRPWVASSWPQLITVVRKGTRALQQLPASTDAFVWLRLYQVEMAGLIPRGQRQPLWWASRRPARPLTYHAVHRMFERASQRAAASTGVTLHSLRHTAAYRMAEDPALPLTDVQFVLGHAQLTTTQIYYDSAAGRRDPAAAGRSCQADPAGRRAGPAGPSARLPARDARCAVRQRRMVTTVTGPASAVVLAATTARESMRARFPARRVPAAWPATLQPRGTAGERLTRPPFVLDDVKRQQRRVRGLAMLLDWLAAQPGQSWQERWLASGADRAGAGLAAAAGAVAARLRPARRRAAG